MFRRLLTAGMASVFALGTAGFTAGFSGPEEGTKKATIQGDSREAAPSTQPVAENVNHEPGKVLGVLPRDPKAERTTIDLTKHYTLGLDEDASGVYGYTLSALPKGIQKLQNVQYDLRGIVQVSGQVFAARNKVFPEAVKGIKVGLKCQALCFLHASRWTEQNGTHIGSYVIHYANGQTKEVPILYGVDLRDWLPSWDPGAAAQGPPVGWHGQNGNLDIVLFKKEWHNPLPDVEISSIDMVSSMTDAAPFLVAVTAQ